MNVGKTELKLRISGRKSGSLDLKHSLLICGKDESLDARRKKEGKRSQLSISSRTASPNRPNARVCTTLALP